MSTRYGVRATRSNPAGFTLLEVVVTLALFGLILGVSGLALASLREPPTGAANQQLIAARDSAIHKGRPISVTVSDPDTGEYNAQRATRVLFLPDGRAVGTGVDQLTGAPLGVR